MLMIIINDTICLFTINIININDFKVEMIVENVVDTMCRLCRHMLQIDI